ncbi:sedoheptulose-7-phosphate:D-glyceraldehyde-3- phosphate transaldolase [Tulasnella sp. 424]|nr:sedoheptulose-7-phosphate:D-glyceraldehyde-3- phosphate transaldolase [Tulasnella sp. 424]
MPVYEESSISKERVLIKIASTWDGTQITREVGRDEQIYCNVTLFLGSGQAFACADWKENVAQRLSPPPRDQLQTQNKQHLNLTEGRGSFEEQDIPSKIQSPAEFEGMIGPERVEAQPRYENTIKPDELERLGDFPPWEILDSMSQYRINKEEIIFSEDELKQQHRGARSVVAKGNLRDRDLNVAVKMFEYGQDSDRERLTSVSIFGFLRHYGAFAEFPGSLSFTSLAFYAALTMKT